jgi:hypothetical protein
MYFNGNLSIDPAQLTKIEKIKPQKAFKRILYFLTAGAISDKEEQETFTAVSILQQMYAVCDSMGINNLVRLSHDDIDFYLDSQGKKDDLKEMLDKYDLETNEAMAINFQQLNMVLEHEDGKFKYLISIDINRTHKVGQYPIDIFVDGLMKDLSAKDGQSAGDLETAMQVIFKDQDSYNSFVMERQSAFDRFINDFKFQINKLIRVDDVQVKSKANILIPKEKKESLQEFKQQYPTNQTAYSPVYHGYHGYGDAFFYAYLWSSMCHTNHIHVHNSYLVSEEGSEIMEVGEEGIDAGDNSLFDSEEDYNSRLEDNDLNYNEDTGEYNDSNSTEDGGGWFDSGGDSGGDGGGCSSCSGCGGCGG